MQKRQLSADGLIAELNRQLRLDEQYQDGMAFLPHPSDASGREMTGYATAGPIELTGVYARVAHKVFEEFELAE